MSALSIDTLKLARRLRDTAGFTPEPAEAAAEAFADAVAGTALVTKEHLDARLFETKTELKGDIAEVRADMKANILRLEHRIENFENRLTIKMGAMIVGLGGFLMAVKFFGHG